MKRHRAIISVALMGVAGCTGISIAPSCPNELQVNESAPVLANEINPGAVAKYFWDVTPVQIGRVTDPTKPSTMFTATGEGEAVVRLTASDGLFQVISQCSIRVAGTSEPPPDDSETDNGDDDIPDEETDDPLADDGKEEDDRPDGVRKTNP